MEGEGAWMEARSRVVHESNVQFPWHSGQEDTMGATCQMLMTDNRAMAWGDGDFWHISYTKRPCVYHSSKNNNEMVNCEYR